MYPDITSTTDYQNLQRTGYINGTPSDKGYCPKCSTLLFYDDEVYETAEGDVVGCSNCLSHKKASDWLEEAG